MAKTVFDVLVGKLTEHRNAVQESISQGGAKDYAEYKDGCGVIRGLTIAIRETQDLARNYMENDDE